HWIVSCRWAVFSARPRAGSRCASWRSGRVKFGHFFVSEYAATRQESDAFGGFDGKAGTASGHHVDDELGMLPVVELVGPDIEFATDNFTQQHILRTDPKVAFRITHRRRPIAAATGLVEHQASMLAFQTSHHFGRLVGDFDPIDHHTRSLVVNSQARVSRPRLCSALILEEAKRLG